MSYETLTHDIVQKARLNEIKIATAESCTGGMIAAAFTDVPGASAVFDYGVVAYANEAKIKLLNVQPTTLNLHGAISQEVAVQMAEGALILANADLAISVTGIAGPDGGTENKPVGTVWFAIACKGKPTITEKQLFLHLDRKGVRRAATQTALMLIARCLAIR